MQIDSMLFHKNKLIRLALIAKQLQIDSSSVFKTKQERDTAIGKLCSLNNKVEEILYETRRT